MSELLDAASTAGTLVAAGLAYITIRQSAKNSDENQKALVRERRIDFELGVLSELVRLISVYKMIPPRQLQALAQMASHERIPLTAAAAGLPSTPEAEARIRQLRDAFGETDENRRQKIMFSQLREALVTELVAEIQVRLAERDAPRP